MRYCRMKGSANDGASGIAGPTDFGLYCGNAQKTTNAEMTSLANQQKHP